MPTEFAWRALERALRVCACVLIGVGAVEARDREDRILADFEGDDWAGWTAEGDAFGGAPARGELPGQQPLGGYRGRGLVNTFRGGDDSLGTLTSPPFLIDRRHLSALVGGGRRPDELRLELVVDGDARFSATGFESEFLRWVSWDVSRLQGKMGVVRIVDAAKGGWGHINVDHIVLSDLRREGFDAERLAEYRASPSYYRELHRPAFHFTPELHWMNDPNGLVFHDGEYHLFYQYNPFGNAWGHMSWGHAVSADLVHWEHLPIALLEEDGVMIFSGCAVVDHRNTSGFGTEESPPLVAIYTAHRPGNQSQAIAYSNDRGRTWTKFAGNPVLDLDEADFRDPKVFWHEPTERWVMVVSLAVAKRLQLWASTDLRSWTHLSDFGPAGAKEKPNWECPDLFELPVEGEPGVRRWVLEVDMGGGSIAGGSGGEYFVGTFDGERFVADEPLDTVRWVDYGRDFYAPVSWSDVPPEDGRRIWIGWMNNWETSWLPTSPWRSAQSIPRSLSLRRTAEGLRLVQRPVDELAALRGRRYRLGERVIRGDTRLLEELGVRGNRLEILATLEVPPGGEAGFRLAKGPGQETVVGWSRDREELWVDRRRSGNVSFDPRFVAGAAGLHAGPLSAADGRVELRIFLDESTLEVFGGDGLTVISDRIFPDPSGRGVSVWAEGAPARIVSIDVWELSSIWR